MTDLLPLLPLCLRSARRALQWRLLALYFLALLPPLALLVIPAWIVLDAQLSHSVHAAALAQQLDLSAITDLLAAGQRQALAAQLALGAALACTVLISPLLAGATLTAARSAASLSGLARQGASAAVRPSAEPLHQWPLSTAPLPAGSPPGRPLLRWPRSTAPMPAGMRAAGSLSFGELLAGGMAEYPRLLRMLLWSAIVMGAVLVMGSFLIELAEPQEALLPDDGKVAGYAARAIGALLLWAAMASLDAGRAMLAADRRRRSVIHAWWLGIGLLRRQPVLALGSYAVLGALGFAAAGLAGLARLHAPVGTLTGDLAGVLLTQVLVLLLSWFRSARLFALVAVARL